MNPDVEGFYIEITNVEELEEMIERIISKYNESNDR